MATTFSNEDRARIQKLKELYQAHCLAEGPSAYFELQLADEGTELESWSAAIPLDETDLVAYKWLVQIERNHLPVSLLSPLQQLIKDICSFEVTHLMFSQKTGTTVTLHNCPIIFFLRELKRWLSKVLSGISISNQDYSQAQIQSRVAFIKAVGKRAVLAPANSGFSRLAELIVNELLSHIQLRTKISLTLSMRTSLAELAKLCRGIVDLEMAFLFVVLRDPKSTQFEFPREFSVRHLQRSDTSQVILYICGHQNAHVFL